MTLYEANLAALPIDLARAVEATAARPDELFETARDGSPINGLARERRPVLFHSGYDPHREAVRLADAAGGAGFVVVLGLGTAHHVRELARRGRRVLVVEPDLRLVRSALARVDLVDLLRGGAVFLAAPNRLEREIMRRYVPALHGDLAVVELTGRVEAEPESFDPCRRAVARLAERIRSDLAVQARFGARWMRNTILNVAVARARPLPSWKGSTVTVAAAGPSLADALPELAADGRTPLVAVDTALPVLVAHGVLPDLVVSIDCQLPSYHHYLTAGFSGVPAAAELSLPPSLFSRLAIRHPVRSDHPLHTLLSTLGLDVPYLDARGGNVTQAAVDLAARLGAREVVVFGADFSYPDGETYPRGSYVHRLFAASAARLSPASALHYAFLLDRPGVRRDPDQPSRWVQPLLSDYAERFAAFAARLPARLTRVPGRGARAGLPPVDSTDRPATQPRSAPARPETAHAYGGAAEGVARRASPRRILGRLREAVHAVSGAPDFARALEHEAYAPQAAAARALLPALTHLRAREEEAPFDELLARAVRSVDAYVDAALERCDGE